MRRAEVLADAAALADYLRAALRPIPEAPARADPAAPRAAAVLAPLYARGGHPHLLFTRRSLDLSAHRGEISFPGGAREGGDATLAQTALRETYEELGLDPVAVEVLGPLPHVVASVSNFLIAPYVGWLEQGLPLLVPNVAEVAEVIEAPLAALAEPAIYHTEFWERAGRTHTVHFYDFGEYRIWGATARMLHSLLELLPAA